MSKKVDIIYFGDIYAVNGINFVTKFILDGKYIFKKNGITLNKIYSRNEIIECSDIETISIGKNVEKKSYKLNRILRQILSKVMTSDFSEFAWFKIRNAFINPAENVVLSNKRNFNSDFIIFQDIFTAYFYFKNEINNKCKTILILHCEKDPWEQLLESYPSIRKSKHYDFLIKIKDFVYSKISQIIFLSKRACLYNTDIIQKSSYIYNGIPDIKNHSFNEINDIINIVCIGSMNGRKGQHFIVEAANKLGDKILNKIHFNFIGDGPQSDYLKGLVDKYNLNKYFTFWGIRKDVDDLLGKMDIMLLPSKLEGLPIVIIEGLRQGMFILATDVGGISEMIQPEFGVLIKRDSDNIKEILEKVILENKIDFRSKFSARDYYLSNFTLEVMINNYSKVINSI